MLGGSGSGGGDDWRDDQRCRRCAFGGRTALRCVSGCRFLCLLGNESSKEVSWVVVADADADTYGMAFYEGGMRRSSRPSTQGSAAAGARSSQLSGGARAATRPDTPRPDAMHGACRAAARAHSPVALQTRKQGAAHAMQRRGRSPAAPGVGSARAGRVGLRRPHGTARRVLSVLPASDPGTRQGARTSPPHRE